MKTWVWEKYLMKNRNFLPSILTGIIHYLDYSLSSIRVDAMKGGLCNGRRVVLDFWASAIGGEKKIGEMAFILFVSI
jgi:hypothetical protein